MTRDLRGGESRDGEELHHHVCGVEYEEAVAEC